VTHPQRRRTGPDADLAAQRQAGRPLTHTAQVRRALPLLLLALLGLLAVPAAAGPDDAVLTVPLADGSVLVVEKAPLQLRLLGPDGSEQLSTVPGRQGPPVRLPGLDGPQPVEPLGAAGGFPALGFVVGADPAVSYPLPLFTGNRLFGAELGVLVSLVEVVDVVRRPGGLDLQVRTDAPSAGPAVVQIRRLPSGGVRLTVTPPDGVDPVSSVVTLASPDGEGLYGLGARKDAFDQRGRLRNVWTEQQNASDERVEPATCATLGCDYTFPNGEQAAYFVQPSLHGSRGWTAWTPQTELSRLDLAASRDDAVRWAVAAPTLDLRLAGGGLEESSATYTADVGRAPAPPAWVYEPWVDVINEGEGEAAPNGGGFSGGQRVRDDLLAIVEQPRASRSGRSASRAGRSCRTASSCSPTCAPRATGCRRTGTPSTRRATPPSTQQPGATCSSTRRPASPTRSSTTAPR
jgi:hypothetical protein